MNEQNQHRDDDVSTDPAHQTGDNLAEPRSAKPAGAMRWMVVIALILLAGVLGVWFAPPIRAAAGSAWSAVTGGDDEDRNGGSIGGPSGGNSGGGGGGGGGVQLYQSGMHPWIITTEPGNCPICGMKLEPIDPSKLTGELAIDPTVVQNMGVRTQEVTTGLLTQTIRTVGSVTYDESAVRTINPKIDGWVEELFVDAQGERVDAGQPLLRVYSPQLFAAQEEYLSVYRRSRDGGSEGLLDAARTRLTFFDLSDEQIEALEQRDAAEKTVTIRSPFPGVVVGKQVTEGMRIEPGMPLYTIADLSRVWVIATVYEQQLPFLREGAAATMTLAYLPGREMAGRVDTIYPYLADRGREVKVRLVFENPAGDDGQRLLKPGMFAEVRIAGAPPELPVELTGEDEEGHGVLVPRSAVLDTGERRVAFVSLGRGRFEPRDLMLGVQVDGDRVQVLSGLAPGEEVVTSGQFLLDSESRLREALAKMVAPAPAPGSAAAFESTPAMGTSSGQPGSSPAPAGGAAAMEEVPPGLRDQVDRLVAAYLEMQTALTRDDLAAARRPLDEMVRIAHGPGVPPVVEAVAGPAHESMAAADLGALRDRFVTLSSSVEAVVRHVPPSASAAPDLVAAYCPMVERAWLQRGQTIQNPYDPAMLRCGEITASLPSSAAAGGSAMPQ